MNKLQNTDFSLLSQEEIDTLVHFLTNKNNFVQGEVMSQDSIDKLIYLLNHDNSKIMMDLFDPMSQLDSSVLASLDFRETTDELCELTVGTDSATGYLVLKATNATNGKIIDITPQLFDENDTTDWGFSITPSLFNRICRILSLKYKKETYEKICSIYAKHTFGIESHKVPDVVLPSNEHLLECML